MTKFTVKDFLDLWKDNPNGLDMYDLQGNTSIQHRGLSILAAFSEEFASKDVAAIKKILTNIPTPGLKQMLLNTCDTKGAFNTFVSDIKKEVETLSDTEFFNNGVQQMVTGATFAIPIKDLPESKTSVVCTLLSEKRILKNKNQLLSRYEVLEGTLLKGGDQTLTKDGVTEFLKALPYKDFEYIYMYMDAINIRVTKLDWASLIKNF